MTTNPTRTPRLLQVSRDDPEAIRAELLAGLTAPTARIAPKYLYDALGSRLFAAITELPEYYPTRTEAAIFARELPRMANMLGPVATLVDLGAGNCEKAARLFSPFRVERYVAVDISVGYLRESLEFLQQQHPAVDMLGIGLDFSQRLQLPPEVGDGPRTLFYPGSSIGNFTPDEAAAFLRQARAECQGGALLIGVDLIKTVHVLEAAYDDALGVTAAFNRNLLRHVNRLAGTDFDIGDWRHVAFFDGAPVAYRDAPRSTARDGRALAACGRAAIRGRRAHAYRELLQVARGRLRRVARTRRFLSPAALDRRARVVRGVRRVLLSA